MNQMSVFKEQLLKSFQVDRDVPFLEEILWKNDLTISQFLKGVWELCDEFVKLEKELTSLKEKNNYVESHINLPPDLSKDTLIKVKDYDNAKWELRYFKAFSEDGVECYVDGRCSTEIEDPEEDYIVWKYAKLLTSNDIAMINFL